MLRGIARHLPACSSSSPALQQTRWQSARPAADPPARRGGGNARRAFVKGSVGPQPGSKSEWWVVDGEMHEVGDHVPLRERFVIPRDNLPNRRRKQMREQFMRRTRLVLKESEHEPWCRRYLELYQELRENWERLYWDEGYSQKIAQDHANYESAEDDDMDFSPYRRSQSAEERMAGGFGANKQSHAWDDSRQVRDKFEYDRERRMRDKAFGPMNNANDFKFSDQSSNTRPFDAKRYFRQ